MPDGSKEGSLLIISPRRRSALLCPYRPFIRQSAVLLSVHDGRASIGGLHYLIRHFRHVETELKVLRAPDPNRLADSLS